ncbi:hypothetical protein PCURB6_28330 [Paenibacillus curdlanolyticus]|nr:hypothetical protein PCURB6_28330 [Paenibacillus curdlanolyticus]
MTIWDNWKYVKPNWEISYEFFEKEIMRQSGLSESKLREVVELFKEYKILT